MATITNLVFISADTHKPQFCNSDTCDEDFNVFMKNQLIETNPVRLVSLFKEDNIRERFITKDELIAICQHVPESVKNILIFAYYTGMRIGEVINLKWTDIDLKNKLIKLGACATKTNEKRVVPLNNILIEILNKTIRNI